MVGRSALSFAISVLCLAACTFAPFERSFAFRMHTRAPHAIVFESDSKTVLFEHEADVPTPPSSMSKMMTLYVVFQHLRAGVIKMDDRLPVGKSAWQRRESSTFLKAGQMVRVGDLIRGVAVSSGNDACITLAEGLMGSQEKFVEEMRRVGAELGLNNSTFVNVTGWPDDGQVMSVRDILVLAVRIFRDFPEYYHVFGEKQFTYNGITQKNYNTLLNYNIGVDGVKTGQTEAGGYGMAASAEKGGRRIFVVVNGLHTETERAYEVKRLLLYSLNRFETKTLFSAGSTVSEVGVWNGKDRKVPIHIREDAVVTFPKEALKDLRVFVSHKSAVAAPMSKDQEVGSLSVKIPGMPDRTFPVYVAKEVKALGPIQSFLRSLRDSVTR
ncbi:MAG: D-alanyl-D-alanine carboxypeptidase family protein [Anaplasma sp.]